MILILLFIFLQNIKYLIKDDLKIVGKKIQIKFYEFYKILIFLYSLRLGNLIFFSWMNILFLFININ